MERFINVAGAQTGPIARDESRQRVVSRLLELMHEAKSRGSDVVVFPELALTTFFPRWWMADEAEIDSFFEREMPSPATRPLFEAAKSLGIGFYLGYAELAHQNGVSAAILSVAVSRRHFFNRSDRLCRRQIGCPDLSCGFRLNETPRAIFDSTAFAATPAGSDRRRAIASRWRRGGHGCSSGRQFGWSTAVR